MVQYEGSRSLQPELERQKVAIPSALSLLKNEGTNTGNELTESGENNLKKNFKIFVLFT
jgi:hypothetical protein